MSTSQQQANTSLVSRLAKSPHTLIYSHLNIMPSCPAEGEDVYGKPRAGAQPPNTFTLHYATVDQDSITRLFFTDHREVSSAQFHASKSEKAGKEYG